MTKDSPSLESLRREIDRIDDALHDLLMKRTAVVERVAASKAPGSPALRPGREAAILRRLIARHQGPFPKRAIVRIWREMMGALVGLQGPFSVAVHSPVRGGPALEMARGHFGTVVPLHPLHSPGQVVKAVVEGQHAVGVLLLPAGADEAEPWWIALTSGNAAASRVVARLPFAGATPAKGAPEPPQALAIACRDHEETGDDRTLVVFETAPDVSRDRLRVALAAAGLETTAVLAVHHDLGWRHLFELAGFIVPGDERLAALAAAKDPVRDAVVIGGYAVPLAPETLA